MEDQNRQGMDREPPFIDGSQAVPENRPEVPTGGRSVMQTVVVIVGALMLVAALLWLLVPVLSAD